MIEIITAYWIKIFATLVVFVGLIILFLRSGGGGSNISGGNKLKMSWTGWMKNMLCLTM